MRVSLDGGRTWQEAPEGARIDIDVPTYEGDSVGMIFNFTYEGLIADLYAEDGENIGTFCNTDYELKDLLFGTDR